MPCITRSPRSVYKKLPYDFQKDFAPITTVALVPNVLAVNASIAGKGREELVALGQGAPNPFSLGSNGNGTAQHLIGTQFQQLTGMPLLHVPYKGSGPLTTDLLGGQIQMSFDTITPVLPHIKSGKLRALAVTTAKRSSALPDVPTLDESGLKGFDIGTWFGVLAPAATPKEVVAQAERRNDRRSSTRRTSASAWRRSAPSRSATPRADGRADQERHGELREAREGREGHDRLSLWLKHVQRSLQQAHAAPLVTRLRRRRHSRFASEGGKRDRRQDVGLAKARQIGRDQ